MKKQFQLLILGAISSYNLAAYADQSINYLNFVLGKNIVDMSIEINDSCKGPGDKIPSENMTAGFYKNGNYYLKVKMNENHSKQCWQNLKGDLTYNRDAGIINYFPDFPDANSYYNVNTINLEKLQKNGMVNTSRITYTPYYLYFSVTGHISLTWLDKNNKDQTATMPIEFALGQTSKRKDSTWFIVGDNQAEFDVSYVELIPSSHNWNVFWQSGITLYDRVHDKLFCLSSNLKDNATIKVNIGQCQTHVKYW